MSDPAEPLSAEEEAEFRGYGHLMDDEVPRIWATLDAARQPAPATEDEIAALAAALHADDDRLADILSDDTLRCDHDGGDGEGECFHKARRLFEDGYSRAP